MFVTFSLLVFEVELNYFVGPAGLDLVVCYFALSDKDKMKAGLIRLLEIPLDIDDDEDKYTAAQVRTDSVSVLQLYCIFRCSHVIQSNEQTAEIKRELFGH